MSAIYLKIFFIITFCQFFGSLPNVLADQPQPQEYEVKAAFLYNFANFVKWPETAFTDAQSPFCICVIGDNPFGQALNMLAEKKIQKRELVIRHCHKMEEACRGRCHILFISASLKEKLPEILRISQRHNMLTVSDIPGFAEQGGVIGLVTVKNKIRFEINLKAAERHGLVISSRLLKLAKIIDE